MRIAETIGGYLFRWREDAAGPVILGRRRIFILPSRSGLLYVAVLLVMLIAAINYNLALGHALVFLLVGLGLTGMLQSFRNLHGLRVETGRCLAVHVGESAEFELVLANEHTYPRRAIHCAAAANMQVVASLDAGSRHTIALPVPATRRGWLPLPRVRLWTQFPLGLFTAWSYVQPPMRCLVYPPPVFTPLPPSRPLPDGSARHGRGGREDFAGFRSRQPSDPLRHVAWKASARSDGERPLLVKQFAGGSDSELDLDWAATDPALTDEARLSVLTGWVLEATARQLVFSLSLPGRKIPAAAGLDHQSRCLTALALYPA